MNFFFFFWFDDSMQFSFFFKSRFSVNSFLPVKDLHFKTLFFFSFRQKKMKNFLKEKKRKTSSTEEKKKWKKILFVCLYFLFYSRSLCF